MNYGELKSAWEQYTNRDDLKMLYPIFEEVIRSKIGRDTKLRENQAVVVLSDKDALPDGYQIIYNVRHVNKGYPLTYMSAQQYFNQSDKKNIYTIEGDVFYTGSGSAIVAYFISPPELVNDDDTNPILNAYPQIYIYAGCIEIQRVADDTESLKNYISHYTKEINLANRRAESGRIGDIPVMRGA